jgi:hypothetical protein
MTPPRRFPFSYFACAFNSQSLTSRKKIHLSRLSVVLVIQYALDSLYARFTLITGISPLRLP